MKKLRVLCLMHRENLPPATRAEYDALPEKRRYAMQVEWDINQALASLGHEVIPVPIEDELVPIRRAIEEHSPHIAFNLLTSFLDIGIYDAHVVSFLELLRTPYTGVNPRGIMLASDKALSKKVLGYHRIKVPGFHVYKLRRARIAKPARLQFPLIVKSTIEHSSVGIAQASVVRDEEALRERVLFVHEHVGTDAIAEEYIEGRELTVSVLGNDRLQTFPVWEMRFGNLPEGSENIATSKVKWDLKYQNKVDLRTGPASDLPEGVEDRLHKLAKRIYKLLNLSGYARVDLRLTPAGDPYVLEANPNPDLSESEDFAVSAQCSGLEYPDLVQRVLNLGLGYRSTWKERQ